MPNPTEISLFNYNFEAKACNELLTAMLNHSDFDYVTVDELRRYSELSQFTFDELRTAVYELCKRGFLHVVLGDRIDKNTLDTVFSSFYELQEEYHNRLYELLRRGVKNHS